VINIADTVIATFPYTPEPEPIKYGVLCVGEGRHTGKRRIGWYEGKDNKGCDNIDCVDNVYRVKNARPVTPADLVEWGWEDE
jgi:hypothetical protein